MNENIEVAGGLIQQLVRPAKIFRVLPSHSDVPVTTSKFGGSPYFPVGGKWPKCGGCRRSLSFVGQLQLVDSGFDLPNQDNFLVFFYCFDCRPSCNSPDNDKCWSVRTYRNVAGTESRIVKIPSDVDHPPQCAIEFIETKSLPIWDLLERSPGAEELIAICTRAAPDKPNHLYAQLAQSVVGELRMRSQLGGYHHGPQGYTLIPAAEFIVQFDSLETPLYDSGLTWGGRCWCSHAIHG